MIPEAARERRWVDYSLLLDHLQSLWTGAGEGGGGWDATRASS